MGYIIQRSIGIGLDKALLQALEGRIPAQIPFERIIGIPDEVPHFQKHDGMAFYGVSFHTDSGIPSSGRMGV